MNVITMAMLEKSERQHWLDTYIQAINNESVQWALYKFGGLGPMIRWATGDAVADWANLHTWPEIAADSDAMAAILGSEQAGVIVRSAPDAVRSVILSAHFSPAALDDQYWGWLPASMFISGDDLNDEIFGNTTNAQNSDAGWLAFVHGNKLKLIPKKSIRHTVSWNNIYDAGAVFGTGDNGPYNSGSNTTQNASVTIGGKTYTVRLLTGAKANPFPEESANAWACADNIGEGSEWNELMYRVHVDAPNCSNIHVGMPAGSETNRHGGPQVGGNWAQFTDEELNMNYLVGGNGTAAWCQETRAADTARRCIRGLIGVAYFYWTTASGSSTSIGWRPVLVLT